MHRFLKWMIGLSILAGLGAGASCLAVVVILSGGSGAPAGCFATTPAQTAVIVESPQWDHKQREIAGLIIGIGRERGFSERDIKIALMVAMQEAKLRNPEVATDHDSLGAYQQRPSQGWGTPQQIINPVYAINKFYDVMAKIVDRNKMELLEVALAVQNPSRKAYLNPKNYFPGWEDEADVLLAGSSVAVPVANAQRVAAMCGENPADREVIQVAGGWQLPLHGDYRLTSGFGSRIDPHTGKEALHDGLDFAANAGTPLYIAADGIVIESRRMQDGGGWGHTIVTDHGGIKTRYAHMQNVPILKPGMRVKGGDRIGELGATGKSTGPHLHFAVYTGGTIVQRSSGPVYTGGEAVDPMKFLRNKGLKP